MRIASANIPTPESTQSFWHSEPNEFLLGHRTTDALPSEADIVIVGSGITGSSAARYLAEDKRCKGRSIVLLEAREACWGATGRNGGHCQPLLVSRGADVAAFEIKNVDAVKSYIDEHNVACEWRTLPACHSYWTEDILEEAEKEIEYLKKVAPEVAATIEVIKDKDQIRKHRVNPDCAGLTITQGAASLWPYKLVAHVLEKLVKDGKLNLQTLTPVTKVTSAEGKHTLHTERGLISAKTVILATNGYTSALLPQFADLIVPARGEMSSLLPPKNSTRLAESHGMFGPFDQPVNDDYLIQRPFEDVPNPAGHLMFGGGRGTALYPRVGVSDDTVIDEGSAAYLREGLLKLLELDGETEGLKELKATHEWTGIMGYSRDNFPWVGELPDRQGLWLCGGYTGHGMPNGTLCGKAIAEMVLAEAAGEDVSLLQEELVKKGDLPKNYILTKERMAQARLLPTVKGVRVNDLV